MENVIAKFISHLSLFAVYCFKINDTEHLGFTTVVYLTEAVVVVSKPIEKRNQIEWNRIERCTNLYK